MFGLTKTQTRLVDVFLVVALSPFTSQNAYAPIHSFGYDNVPIYIQPNATKPLVLLLK